MRRPSGPFVFPALAFILAVSMIVPALLLTTAPADAAGRYDSLLLSQTGRAKLVGLAAMEDSRKLAGIEKYTGDPDPLIRLRCAEVLGRVGGPGAVPHLARLSADTDGAVVLAAIYSLGLTLDEAALEPLEKVLKNGKKEQKLAALEALGITRLKEAAPLISESLTNFHSTVRAQAVASLAVLGDSSFARTCASSIHDPDADVIEQTAYALGRLGYKDLDFELAELCEHENLWVAMRAVEALGRLEAKNAVEAIAPLLTHKNRMLRIKAAEALSRLATDDAAEKLETVLGSDDAYMKDYALRGIAAARRGKSFDAVLPLLHDTSQMVRRSAIEAAAMTDAKKARPFLLEMVREGNPYDRMAALEFIGTLGQQEDMLLLVEMLDKSVNHLEREGAAAGLKLVEKDEYLLLPVGSNGRTAFDVLLDAAGGDDPVVAAMAVEALDGKRAIGGTDRLVEAFRRSTGREDCDRKLAIIAVFAGIAGEGALEPAAVSNIVTLLKESVVQEGDPRVAEASAGAVKKYGYVVSYDPARAAAWDRGTYPWGDPALPLGKKMIRMTTKKGTVDIELFGDDAPTIVKSMLLLIEEGFYNGLNFHRVVPGFVVQGGCPRGDGWGDAGWFLRSQFNSHRYERGYVGMAHSGKDTPGSQFFITHLPQPHLDGRYTIIGRVVSGMEIVDFIEVGDTFGMENIE
jgi:cyclophilin family peptidyl-prolyl cis-trans isomerase/HEAT repeat protein